MVVPQLRFYDLELSNAPETFVSPNTCKTRYTLNIKVSPNGVDHIKLLRDLLLILCITTTKI